MVNQKRINMGVKTEQVTENPEEIQDDVSGQQVVEAAEEASIDEGKLNDLKAKLAKKQNKEETMPPRIVERKRRSLNFGVVGSGQGGSRLSEAFFNLGYSAICFNTAPQDLEHIQLPEENKYLLKYGIGGAAKEIELGRAAAEAHKDGINALVHEKLGDAQVFLFCLSLGGGSGAGSCET